MAKSRLTPLKAMTIPRMELSAAVLETRLDRIIKQEVDMAVHSSTFWTDSTCKQGLEAKNIIIMDTAISINVG